MAVKQVFNTSAELNYPMVLPTLDLDFANSKTLDPRITFTRASGGSYVGADGLIKYAGVNEARFDHDPVTGESLGLLIEETRFNAYNYSEQLVSPYYNLLNVSTISNFDTSPDGKQTATKIVENTQNIPHYIAKSPGTVAAGTPCTVSCFVKATSSNRFFSIIFENLSLFGGDFPRAGFDLNNGTIVSGSVTTGLATPKIENYGNGWYRCSLATTPLVTGNMTVQFRPQAPSTSVSLLGPYQGDGISGLLLWGLQFDLGFFPTSYIPTQGSTRTRAADSVSITGKNFSEWYRQDEGTVFCEAKGIDNISGGNTRRYYEFNNQGSSNFRILSGYLSSTVTRFLIVNNGLLQADLYQTNQSPFKNNVKTASSFGNGYFRFYSNGLSAPPVNFGTVPTLDGVFIGSDGVIPSLVLNGTIKRFTYYPKRLPDSQLQALTS